MKSCKFCGRTDGHINRDSLCAPCANIINKACYDTGKLSAEALAQFEANCRWNLEHGMYVPRRYRLKLVKKRCAQCGVVLDDEHKPDRIYKNHCTVCAYDKRHRNI